MTPVDPNEHDLFLLRQRWAPVINRYEFTLPTLDGGSEQPVCFVEQKRFKFKEDIRFFSDDTKVALVRRLVGFIPFIGGFADWLPIPYHFIFERGERVLATNTRRAWKIPDTYTIDLSGDSERTLDRRLVLATAVGMDALQAR